MDDGCQIFDNDELSDNTLVGGKMLYIARAWTNKGGEDNKRVTEADNNEQAFESIYNLRNLIKSWHITI